MKKKTPYANNKGGIIKAPHNTTEGQPKSTVTKGGDLRARKSTKQ